MAIKRINKSKLTIWGHLVAACGKPILLLVCGFGLFMGVAAANEIDLDKPIELEPGKGVAVFSATVTNPNMGGIRLLKQANLSWRAVGGAESSGSIRISVGGGLFSTLDEALAKQHRPGRFAALQLPEGTYEWYDASATSNDTFYPSEQPFSRKFRVKAGQISYVGNIDILPATDALREGGRYAFAVFAFLIPFSKADFKPWLSDQSAQDFPLLHAKGAKLTAQNLVRDILPDEADTAMEKRIAEIAKTAERGDLNAKNTLGFLYFKKFFVDETGIMRANRDILKAEVLFAQLANAGDGEAAYLMAMAHDPGNSWLSEFKITGHPEKALRYFQTAAEHYYAPAMERLAKIYANGELGAAESPQLAKLWNARADRLNEVPTVPPYLDAAGMAAYKAYQDETGNPKHFALSPSGAFGWAGYASGENEQPYQAALKQCEARNPDKKYPCRAYLTGSRLRWNACAVPFLTEDSSTAFVPADLPELDAKAVDNLPSDPALRKAFQDFLTQPMPRALAVSPTGAWAVWAGDCRAPALALQQCSRKNGGAPCELFAQDDRVTAKSDYGQSVAAKYSGQQDKLAGVSAMGKKK